MRQDFSELKIKKLVYPNLIYDQIISSIKSGALKPGDALPGEGDLVKQFGVGRTSVREAIAGLEYMNVITTDNGEYRVSEDLSSYFKKKLLYHYQMSEEKNQDAFVVRRLLEKQFVLLACQRATPNDLAFLHRLLTEINDLLLSGEGKAMTEALSTDLMERLILFHSALAAASQNSLLVRIFDRFKDIFFFDSENNFTWENYHTYYRLACQITAHIESRSAEEAVSAMRSYLDHVEADMLQGGEGA